MLFLLSIDYGKEAACPRLWLACAPSDLMFSSPEAIWRESEKESLLDPEPASTELSEDNVNAGGAVEDPSRRRTTGTSGDEGVERLYAKIPIGVAIGWSNLQFGPNLQIP